MRVADFRRQQAWFRLLLLIAALPASTISGVSDARGAAYAVQLRNPSTTRADRLVGVTIEITTNPHTRCTARVTVAVHGSMVRRNLPALTTSAKGDGLWEWQINGKVPSGRWTLRASCSLRGPSKPAEDERSFNAPRGAGKGSEVGLFVPGSVHARGIVIKGSSGGDGGGANGRYPRDQCTWWVANARPDLPYFPGQSGDALNWATSARRHHIPTGTEPVPGAVAVFQPGEAGAGEFGHVAYVLSVDTSTHTIRVSEENFTGRQPDERPIYWAGLKGLRFIYGGPAGEGPASLTKLQDLAKQAEEELRAREQAERERREARAREEQRAKEAAEAKEREEREHKETLEREQKEREVITSVNETHGDLAPYDGEFTVAFQKFTAASDRLTYAGVVIANPALPVGPDEADQLDLKICDAPECGGSVLADIHVTVNNYGLSAADLGEVTVVPGSAYYLVWTPPANAHGSKWLAFWHAGKPHIVGSEELEAVVRGYEHEGAGPNPPKRALISYQHTKPPPAPFAGPFIYADEPFKAASNRITEIGAVVGNPERERLEEVGTMTLRLCETADCTSGVLATATPSIINYGVTKANIGRIAVTPGKTYYVNWTSPPEIGSEAWVTFWRGRGPTPEQATAMEAFAKGYDEGALKPTPSYVTETAEAFGAPTFRNYANATEEGLSIEPAQTVEVTCKVFAPKIASSEPDGYWYLIHTKPWNDAYYAVANAFRNAPEGSEVRNTDPSVPDC